MSPATMVSATIFEEFTESAFMSAKETDPSTIFEEFTESAAKSIRATVPSTRSLPSTLAARANLL